MHFFLLRCEDLKQERGAVVDGMMELENAFLTATNKKVVMILDQVCRNLMLANLYLSRSCASVDSIVRTNDLTQSSVFMHAWCYMGQ